MRFYAIFLILPSFSALLIAREITESEEEKIISSTIGTILLEIAKIYRK